MKSILSIIKDHITLILAVSSIYIYFCVYGYELSYLKAFNIPSNYVTIDFTTVFLDSHYIMNIILTVCIILSVSRLLHVYFVKKSAKAGRLVKWSTIVALSTVSATVLGESSQIVERFAPYILLIIEVVVIVLCLTIPVEKSGMVSANEKVEESTDLDLELNEIIKTIMYSLLFMLVLFAFVIVNSLGSGQASHQSEFQVIDSTNYVVVRKYGDQLLCVDYDTTKMIVGTKVSLIKLYSNKPVFMTTKTLGRIADVPGQLEIYEKRNLGKSKPNVKPLSSINTNINPTKAKLLNK